ncbi:uncharacterized protein LOC143850745 [Tasmannia lanceolata]|uniref:uncharacterized protein LOC143850745 n=1 Tax=Tasmannia lanceolata TaxID=3420 RepID=UPI004064661E
MPDSEQHTRINLGDLKSQIVKKVGPDRAQRYLYYLSRFLSEKLSKTEFDKQCYLTIGRENLPLHNQLIRSILKNACQGKVPPPIPEKEGFKSVQVSGKRPISKEDGYPQSGPSQAQIQTHTTTVHTPLVWSNGDVLPMSPRKGRSGIRDRRLRDRPSPLGPNGKMGPTFHQLITTDEVVGKGIVQNGDVNSCDLQRPMHHHQGLAEQPENGRDVPLSPPTKRPRINRLPQGLDSVHSKSPVEFVVVEEGEEVEGHDNISNSARIRSPLRAPLGIPFCSASMGGARRALPMTSSSSFTSTVKSSELSDTESLRKRMEQIAGAEGLDGVSIDCTNLLNNGLDAYLKRLIRSSIELVGARSGHEPVKHSVYKPEQQGKLINGIRPGHHRYIQSSSGTMEVIREPKNRSPISLLDFKVAMELNPQQLGEDWPLLLETISQHSCEE